MEFVRPECGEKMTVLVGLSSDTSNSVVECHSRGNNIVALVPGPVVGGPFRASA